MRSCSSINRVSSILHYFDNVEAITVNNYIVVVDLSDENLTSVEGTSMIWSMSEQLAAINEPCSSQTTGPVDFVPALIENATSAFNLVNPVIDFTQPTFMGIEVVAAFQ